MQGTTSTPTEAVSATAPTLAPFDPQRDLDLLRTLRDAIHAGTHPLFRVPVQFRNQLPSAPQQKVVEEPAPPVVTVSSSPAPPAQAPDLEPLVSYEEAQLDVSAAPEPEEKMEIEQLELDSDDSDSDSDSDSDVQVAAQLIQPLRTRARPLHPSQSRSGAASDSSTSSSVPSLLNATSGKHDSVPSNSTEAISNDQAVEVIILSSDSESTGDPEDDDIILPDSKTVEVREDPSGPQAVPTSSVVKLGSHSIVSPPRDVPPPDSACSETRASPPTTAVELTQPAPVSKSNEPRRTTRSTGEPSQQGAPENKLGSRPEQQVANPTPASTEDPAARLAREREAAVAPTKGVSAPRPNKKETRGERKDREAREIAEKRERDKAEKEARENGGSQVRPPGATMNTSVRVPSTVAPPTKKKENANRPQAAASRQAAKRRAQSPPRPRKISRRSLSPVCGWPLPPIDRGPARPLEPRYGRPRSRSPLPLPPPRTRSPSPIPSYLPRRAGSVTHSLDGARRFRSRSPPLLRRGPPPSPHAIEDRRFPPYDDHRPLVDDYDRIHAFREREYSGPPRALYRGPSPGPPPPRPIRSRSRSRSPSRYLPPMHGAYYDPYGPPLPPPPASRFDDGPGIPPYGPYMRQLSPPLRRSPSPPPMGRNGYRDRSPPPPPLGYRDYNFDRRGPPSPGPFRDDRRFVHDYRDGPPPLPHPVYSVPPPSNYPPGPSGYETHYRLPSMHSLPPSRPVSPPPPPGAAWRPPTFDDRFPPPPPMQGDLGPLPQPIRRGLPPSMKTSPPNRRR